MVWRICVIVTEQSHVFECRRWCVLISKVIRGLCVQHIRALVVSDQRLSFLCRMAHFSAFDDSTASHFVRVRIRFYPCNNHYLAGFSWDVTKSGNGERGTGNEERGTGVWERVYSGFPHNNSKWRTHEKKNTDDKCSSICWRRIYFVMLTL